MKSKRVPMLVVKYENLVSNLYSELKRMMDFHTQKMIYSVLLIQLQLKISIESIKQTLIHTPQN